MNGTQYRIENGNLPAELRRLRDTSPDAACLFRLCCVRLVLAGQRPDAVSDALGISERSIRRWLDLYQGSGVDAVCRGLRSGRPGHLNQRDLAALLAAMDNPPQVPGSADWNGALVQRYVQERFGVALGLRQCQRLLHRVRRRTTEGPAPGPAAGAEGAPGVDDRGQDNGSTAPVRAPGNPANYVAAGSNIRDPEYSELPEL